MMRRPSVSTTKRTGVLASALFILLAAGGSLSGVAAQQAPAKTEAPVLKVDVLLTRQLGNKKISSIPHSLLLTPGTGAARLRTGVELPGEPLTTTSKEGVTTTRRDSRFVGTSIDCSFLGSPSGVEPGQRYRLLLSVADSGFLPEAQSKTMGAMGLRTFSSSTPLAIRDGQTLVFTVGTDPITGETLRAEVTISVVK
jgi:hypothetical protein